jgi:hypothetical protein
VIGEAGGGSDNAWTRAVGAAVLCSDFLCAVVELAPGLVLEGLEILVPWVRVVAVVNVGDGVEDPRPSR